jgi:hypothetical protein
MEQVEEPIKEEVGSKPTNDEAKVEEIPAPNASPAVNTDLDEVKTELDKLDKERLKDLILDLMKEQPSLEEKVKGEILNIIKNK